MTEKSGGPVRPEAASEQAPSGAAALFDLRSVIALLFGFYGIVLTILGVIGASPEDLAKAGGIAINLWTGIGMLVLAGLFLLWLRLSPPLTGRPAAE